MALGVEVARRLRGTRQMVAAGTVFVRAADGGTTAPAQCARLRGAKKPPEPGQGGRSTSTHSSSTTLHNTLHTQRTRPLPRLISLPTFSSLPATSFTLGLNRAQNSWMWTLDPPTLRARRKRPWPLRPGPTCLHRQQVFLASSPYVHLTGMAVRDGRGWGVQGREGGEGGGGAAEPGRGAVTTWVGGEGA
jgi:hypothetical protein